MSALSKSSAGRARYELRFMSLLKGGRGFTFPCDVHGHVELTDLSERGRTNYFYARAVRGREFSVPVVMLVEPA
jgi:hypothetical protein